MKIVRTRDMAWTDVLMQGRFGQRRKELGGQKLNGGLWELPPGKTSFPLHAHAAVEEALFVVSGHAKVRTPAGDSEIGPGDFVSFSAGGPAHQLVNDGAEPLVYVAVSSFSEADVVHYPRSGKVAYRVGYREQMDRKLFRAGDAVQDYLEGED